MNNNKINNSLSEFTIKEIEETERKILNCIFFHYNEIENLIDIEGTPKEFFITQKGRNLFEALQRNKKNKQEKFDIVDISSTLKIVCKTKNELLECEKELHNFEENFNYYTIVENWNRLKAFNMKIKMNALAKEILNTSINCHLINDQISEWKNKIDKICSSWSPVQSQDMDEALKEWDKFVHESINGEIINFPKTRFFALDEKIRDLGAGKLMILASRPGIGKTTFALNLIHQNIPYLKRDNKNPWSIGMFSLEMTNISLIGKMISMTSCNPFSVINDMLEGKTIEEWQIGLINQAKQQLSNTNIYLCDNTDITLGNLISQIKTWVAKHNLKIVIIDYLQIINIPTEEENWSSLQQYQKIGMISRTLKQLALQLEICIIALSQLNRKVDERVGNDKSPILSDLRESGSIEQDADVVMFLYENTNKRNPNDKSTILKIAKNRNGSTGMLEFKFDKTRGLFKCLGEV